MTKLPLSASLLASTLALFVLTGCGLSSGDFAARDGQCGAAAMALPASPLVEETGWKLPLTLSIHDAAAECGVVALPNAPATLSVSFSALGGVASVDVDSSIFGGDETVACISGQLEPIGAAARGAPMKVALVELAPGA